MVSLSLEDPVLWWDQVGKLACTDVPPPRFVMKQNGYDPHLLVHTHTHTHTIPCGWWSCLAEQGGVGGVYI